MWRWRAVVLAFLSLSSPSLNSSGRGAANGWNLPRFTSDGATLYSAASAVTAKPGTDVIVLDQENSFVFDADGKAVRNRYLVYKILTQKGVDGWDAASLGWEPWHEERPNDFCARGHARRRSSPARSKDDYRLAGAQRG